jgi:hypothetical protein
MWPHARSRCTANPYIVLAFWAVGCLILAVGCSASPPPPTPAAVAPTAMPTPALLGETPSISLDPSGPVIPVQPGEKVAIGARPTGVEPQVTWTATCSEDQVCKVLQPETGKAIFFTAPSTLGEQVIVLATVKDKYGRENNAQLTFKVQKQTVAVAPTEPPTAPSTETIGPGPTEPAASSTPTEGPSPTLGSIIELNLTNFVSQASKKGGKVDEFYLDTTSGSNIRLPVSDGVDLSDYDLEFTFRGGDGKQVQLWYKDQDFHNVYSCPGPITSDQPIHFNPTTPEERCVDEFTDFTHIYAIGAKVLEGVAGVEIASAKLIRR